MADQKSIAATKSKKGDGGEGKPRLLSREIQATGSSTKPLTPLSHTSHFATDTQCEADSDRATTVVIDSGDSIAAETCKVMRVDLRLGTAPASEPARLQVIEPDERQRRQKSKMATPQAMPGFTKGPLLQVHPRSRLPVVTADDRPPPAFRECLRELKTWGVSFVIHTVAVVVLALMTMNVVQHQAVRITAATLADEDYETLDMLTTINAPVFQQTESFENSLSEESPWLTELELENEGDRVAFESVDFVSGFANSLSLMDNIAGADVASPTELGTSATFCGISASGKSFVFVVDRSGSMMGEAWNQAQAELFRSISSLAEQQEFFIVLFNHQADTMHGLRGKQLVLRPATLQNIEMAKLWIFQQFPDGGTMPKDAIAQALRMDPDAIFFLSDGIFQDGTLEYLRAHNSIRRVSQGKKQVVVHTIAFKDYVGAHVLQQIAKENDGNFTFVQ